MRFDIHVHTTVSACGELHIDDILKNAKSFGLDGVCITDHDSMDIRHQVNEGMQENGLCVIFGMEYTTLQGDFLLFGPFEDIPLELSSRHLLNLVDKMGGAAVAAHPFRTDRPVQESVIHEGLCNIIESVNGRNTEIENLKIEKWRKKYTIIECGGSDAHTLNELGSVVTRFAVPIQSREDVIKALKTGSCKPERTITAGRAARIKP